MLSDLQNRVLVLDGALGTMVQRCNLTEAHFRGARFASHPLDLKGCNDVLVLSAPQVIAHIHRQYVEAGADIISTDSFNANPFSLAEYGLTELTEEINCAAAELAASVAHPAGRFVAGSMGPTGVSLSLGGDISFDQMADGYARQASGLLRGGADLLLLETAFDTLNAKAAICGIERAMAVHGRRPLIISATLTESGRLLSGQSLAAFVTSVSHARPLAIGLNCGFGADALLPHLRELAALTPAYVSCHPNAGLPDEMGRYVHTPEIMAAHVEPMLREGLVNIIGGCCGTTPEHIAAIAALARKASPRRPAPPSPLMQLSALEAVNLPRNGFAKVGERCNVAGSRKFLRLISEGNFSEALNIAASQVAAGATLLDVNMDDAMLDTPEAMARFVSLLTLDPRTASTPLMIDSSDFRVIQRALKLIQGRPLVNSISLKEGEEAFLRHARTVRSLGAAVVVMAFDERGQADTLERRIEICSRSYRLLTEQAGFNGNEIVFDPNVLAVATGIDAHANYGADFLAATRWITDNLPGAHISGGISNLSFSFRGNNPLRKAMHALFIAEGKARGLSMAIMNPAAPDAPTPDMDPELLAAIGDVIFNRHPQATARLTDLAAQMTPSAPKEAAKSEAAGQPSLSSLIVSGSTDGIKPLLDAAVQRLGNPMAVINGELMEGMNRVGRLFGEGKMFLPQVVRAAAAMKCAVDHLTPFIEAEQANSESADKRPVMVLATVKGDVHDIGKNIVAVVMRCAGFHVVDLGVMVPAEKIVDNAKLFDADLVGLSGLITPSLAEMCRVAEEMQRAGLRIPLFVGGATTGEVHTAVKIAPLYDGPVVHTADAASLPAIAARISSREEQDALRSRQEQIRRDYAAKTAITLTEARQHAVGVDAPSPTPSHPGEHLFHLSKTQVDPYFNRRALLGEWRVDPSGRSDEARQLLKDATRELSAMKVDITAKLLILPARRTDPEVVTAGGVELLLPRSLHPNTVDGSCPSLADYVSDASGDHIGLFAVCVRTEPNAEADSNEYRALLRRTIAHRLAEAATQWLHRHSDSVLWGLDGGKSIRPAVGYSSLPDQRLIFSLDKLLRLDRLGITLTENGAMSPDATTCGLIVAHPKARYF